MVHSTIILTGSLGFIFCRKLASTKNQQGTEKASEHYRTALFLQYLVLITCASTEVVSTLFYPLSSFHFNYPKISPTSIFSSFRQARYGFCRCNCVSVTLGGTLFLSLLPPILHPICQAGLIHLLAVPHRDIET